MDLAMSDDDSFVLPPREFALHDAAELGSTQAIEEILQAAQKDTVFDPEQAAGRDGDGVDVNELDDSECTPLHIALLKGHVDVVRLLVQNGARVELACEGTPPLQLAVCSSAHAHRIPSALANVTLLLENGAHANQRDENGRTALHWAAALGRTELMDALVAAHDKHAEEYLARLAMTEEGNEGNATPISMPSLQVVQDKMGNTALHVAAGSAQESAVVQLLGDSEGIAAASVPNKAQQLPLHCAAAQGNTAVVHMLLAANREAAEQQDKFLRMPLHWAQYHGHEAVAQLFENFASGDEGEAELPNPTPKAPTLIVAPPACLLHRTAPEPFSRASWSKVPPENVCRLRVLTNPEDGILKTSEFGQLQWDEVDRLAPLADVLRVHDWTYVRRIQSICYSIPDSPAAIDHLDPDTALSRGTWRAALAGAGACCHAIDCIMKGQARNAFCAIRPPGHHAGPLGTVTSANDPHGSQGFCFINNIAIAAAYAMNVYRSQGIRRVALLDFDVHHGNGTQACVEALIPHTRRYGIRTPLCEGDLKFQCFSPWLDEDDADNVLFASVQGYGKKPEALGGFVYPGSGDTCDTKQTGQQPAEEGATAGGGADDLSSEVPPDDPDLEFATRTGSHPSSDGARIINVGIPGPGLETSMWRRAWRDKILPAVADFQPDLIIVSAGFDAHRKDELNFRFIGLTEKDYYWVTQQLVALANTVCQGRLVSALEGGYRIQGGIVSAFSRSVAAHVRALGEVNNQVWQHEAWRKERALELQRRREVLAARRANALKAAQRAAQRQADLQAQALAQAQAQAEVKAEALPAQVPAAEESGLLQPPNPAVGQGVSTANGTNDSLPSGPQAELASLQAALQAAPSGGDRKRRRGAVDYAALNLKLLEEEAAALQGNGGRPPAPGPASSQPPPLQPTSAPE